MSFENLKLNKQLLTALEVAGITVPTPFQTKVIPRIMGGQELICIAPEGSGRTTALVLSVIMRLKYADGLAPRALILVSKKEAVLELVALFKQFAEQTDLRTVGLYSNAGIEGQKEQLLEGADVVVGTPDRVLALYLKSGINLNKLQQFILDDAELIVKQGLAGQIHELSVGLPKCQRLEFTEVLHDKLERMNEAFLTFPTILEIEPDDQAKISTIPQVLYHVPNFKTKQNLLNLLMGDRDTYKKTIVFTNTLISAQNLYKSLSKRYPDEVEFVKPKGDIKPERQIVNFKKTEDNRVLFVVNESIPAFDLNDFDHIIHFDLPEAKSIFIERITSSQYSKNIPVSITFSTEAELPMVKKIELTTGIKMEVEPLPFGLIIEGTRKRQSSDDLQKDKIDPEKGAAFHEKKASNAKTYNYGWKEKNKLFGKKNRR